VQGATDRRHGWLPDTKLNMYLSAYRLVSLPQLELLELQARQRLATLARLRPIPEAAARVAADMPAELLLRRPDLRSAERRLSAGTHLEAGAVRDLYPKLSLSGAAGVQADTVGSLFEWPSSSTG